MTVSNGEVLIDARMDPVELVRSCKATVSTAPGRAVVNVQGSSTLTTSAGLANAEGEELRAALFAGGDVDVAVNLRANVRARLGKALFNRCFTKYRSEFPSEVLTRARVWVGARIFASDVRIERRPYDPNIKLPNIFDLFSVTSYLSQFQNYPRPKRRPRPPLLHARDGREWVSSSQEHLSICPDFGRFSIPLRR